MANLYIYMLEPCVYIYNTYTLCGVPLVSKISFLDFRMPPNKRKSQDMKLKVKVISGLLYTGQQKLSVYTREHTQRWLTCITVMGENYKCTIYSYRVISV